MRHHDEKNGPRDENLVRAEKVESGGSLYVGLVSSWLVGGCNKHGPNNWMEMKVWCVVNCKLDLARVDINIACPTNVGI